MEVSAQQGNLDQTAQNHLDYGSVYGNLYSKFPQETKTAGSMPLSLIKVSQNSHETADPAVDEIVFRLVTQSDMSHSSVDCGNGRVTLSGRKGSFYLAPADAASYWEGEGKHELLMLALSKSEVCKLLSTEDKQADPDSLRELYNRDIFNGMIPNLINRIWTHSIVDGPGSSLLVDGLFMTLLGTLAGLAENSAEQSENIILPLDSRRLLEVNDYVDANLDKTLSLTELAKVAGLSMFHFSRCFKLATNTTPHMYVTSRRIEASRAMLSGTQASIADIAYDCGFSSQAYFTTKFKEHTGLTPGAYRSELCG